MEDERERTENIVPIASSMFKKRRSKPRTAGVSDARHADATDSTSRRAVISSGSRFGEDDDGDEGASSSVIVGAAGRRGVSARGRGASSASNRRVGEENVNRRLPSSRAKSLKDEEDGSGDDSFSVRRDVRVASTDDAASALPLHMQQQASIGDESDSAYSPANIAELRQASDSFSMRASDQFQGNGNGEAREKFAMEFAHNGIPSEAMIKAAKEKRRKAAADQDRQDSEDFISLQEYRGPHPESRLQREEDDIGSGEEEFSSFTGATERVALDRKGKELEKERERHERRDALEVAMDEDANDSDDSEREWEKAQLGRVDTYAGGSETVRRTARSRETLPYKPAPIPRTAPLPTVSSSSARLQQRLRAMQGAISAQEQLHDDAIKKLEQLAQDEQRNKTATERTAEREAWFREFEHFIASMALFLEQKVPKLLDVETAWIGHLAVRCRLIQKARADALLDQLSLFYGIPSSPLFVGAHSSLYDPAQDGGPLSEVRTLRRQQMDTALGGQLLPSDQSAFDAVQHQIQQSALALLDDVQADEYRDPAVRVDVATRMDEEAEKTVVRSTKIHPASLVARFHRWRKLYGAEYNNAWGGLTLASVWDFWARRSLCGWDAFRIRSQDPNTLDGFKWYKDLRHYAEKGQENHESGEVLGGDDEGIAHVLTNTVLPLLSKVCGQDAFDAWSSRDNASILSVMEETSYVLEKDEPRLQSLLSAILLAFEKQIDMLVHALNTSPAFPPPAISPKGPTALLSCTEYVYNSIICHLISWHRFVHPTTSKPVLRRLTETIVHDVLFALLEMARYVDGGMEVVHRIASDLLLRTSRPALLGETIQSRLAQYVRQN